MYKVIIYDKDFNALTTLFPPNVYDLQYTNELSKAGNATFKINTSDAKATAANLKIYNKVKIYKDSLGEFIGYIEELEVNINTIEVRCIGILGLFSKRLYSANIITASAATAFNAILTATNALDDTGIVAGTSDIVFTINNLEFQRSDVLSAWQKIANLAGGEFSINTDGELDFKQTLGTDKSSSIIFQYVESQINTANIYEFDVRVSGKDTINSVEGIRDGGATNTQTNPTSIGEFGLLEDSVNFAQTNNATDLAAETLNYVNDHSIEFYTPKITPNIEKIDVDSFGVGDKVRVVLQKGFILVNEVHRIIKKTVKVSNNSTVRVDISLIPEAVNLLPSSFFEDIMELDRRIGLLEGGI